jgi:hypothetical protein
VIERIPQLAASEFQRRKRIAEGSDNPASPIRPALGCGKGLLRRESLYKSAPASPKTAAVQTYPVAGVVVF